MAQSGSGMSAAYIVDQPSNARIHSEYHVARAFPCWRMRPAATSSRSRTFNVLRFTFSAIRVSINIHAEQLIRRIPDVQPNLAAPHFQKMLCSDELAAGTAAQRIMPKNAARRSCAAGV